MAELDPFLDEALVARLGELWITTPVDLLSALHEDRPAMGVTLAMSDEQLEELIAALEQARRAAQPAGGAAPEDPPPEAAEEAEAEAFAEEPMIEFDDRARQYGAWIEEDG